MECVQGKSIVEGIAIGKISVYSKEERQIRKMLVEDTAAQWQRYLNAKAEAEVQLQQLYEKAVAELGESDAQIFQMHIMMLQDDSYNQSVKNIIEEQRVQAEYAVSLTGDIISRRFVEMEDEYLRERNLDIKDITQRVIHVLTGRSHSEEEQKEPIILVAKELTPSETVRMNRKLLLAFVMESASTYSHTAILARTMNIPAVTGVRILPEWEGKFCVVDGFEGKVYIEPDAATMNRLLARQEEYLEKKQKLQGIKEMETISKDGRKISLCANIGAQSDVEDAIASGAEGIGLFRTEFLFLEGNDYPTEQEQFQVYQYVAKAMGDKQVIIRTLDIGADKQADYFGLDKESNPAMGYRAIRVCLDREEMFKTQLRAILRAAAYGNVAIMFPMIISLDEVKRAKELLEEAKQELAREGVSYGQLEVGIMIETPAAAMISDELAKVVDFFSIGTNDLTQYTLAIDRQNEKLDAIYDTHHPAVLKMIEMVVRNGHAGGAWVGICGELGADTQLTKWFLDMGVDELSVTPASVLTVRQAVMES